MSEDSTRVDQSAEAEMVKSLLNRQDEVMAELDLLEAQILNVIEDLSTQRKAEIEGEDNGVVPMESGETNSPDQQPLPKAA